MEPDEIAEMYAKVHEELSKKLPLELKEQLNILEDCFNALRDIIEERNT